MKIIAREKETAGENASPAVWWEVEWIRESLFSVF
jgi:hypothetical protein